LSTGAKIAIGCAVAFLLGVLAVAGAVFGGLWWVKGKTEQLSAHERRIDELKAKANAVPFTAPADGVVQEDRLLKFIEIRRRLFAVYVKHRNTLEAIQSRKEADLEDVRKGLSVFNEARGAQAEALADVGMSEDEYRFLVEQVYKSGWAAATASPLPADVPAANVALFKKHEAELRQYAMAGLEWIGL
jgi:hypothetical protein